MCLPPRQAHDKHARVNPRSFQIESAALNSWPESSGRIAAIAERNSLCRPFPAKGITSNWQDAADAAIAALTGTPTPRRPRSRLAASPEGWQDKPAKLRQKDRERPDGPPAMATSRSRSLATRAMPASTVATVSSGVGKTSTDAAADDGRTLRMRLLDTSNPGSTVRADSAYRTKANEAFMEKHGIRSQVHHRKQRGAGLWRRKSAGATPIARRYAPALSMSSRPRRGRWLRASERLAARGPGRGSASPTSPAPSAGWSSSGADTAGHDGIDRQKEAAKTDLPAPPLGAQPWTRPRPPSPPPKPG